MAIDIKEIGTFGISFSKGLDQTWLNLWKKDYGYSLDLYQDAEVEDSDEDDDLIQTEEKISFELGEKLLKEIFEKGHLEEWKTRYTQEDEGEAADLNWTIDVDDTADADMMLLSGNWKLPPNGWMMEVLRVIRTEKPEFAKCFRSLRD